MNHHFKTVIYTDTVQVTKLYGAVSLEILSYIVTIILNIISCSTEYLSVVEYKTTL